MVLQLDLNHALKFVDAQEIHSLSPAILHMHQQLHHRTGLGSEYLGWIDWPISYDQEEYARIKLAARRIQETSDAFVVIGVGGSYLGARAVIEMLTPTFHNERILSQGKKGDAPAIYYVGHHMSTSYIQDLFQVIEDRDISINVISKSGTTTETAIAFRLFKEYMERKYGREEARKRIYVTTDRSRGALKALADAQGYETFVIPDDIGGRYSVLTAVGLLPIAVSGIDVDALMAGAQEAVRLYGKENVEDNPAYQYASLRHLLYKQGYKIEVLANYNPRLMYYGEWWKQLFGESHGKNHLGIFPATANYTTDLHSFGQYIQDGERHLFETVLMVKDPAPPIMINEMEDNADGLNYLAGKTLEEINYCAYEGSLLAHVDGGVPNLIIQANELNAYTIGQLLYFFMKACAMSGYLLGINPFDQPGVEAYKRNMYALLGKSGYEIERDQLLKRLNALKQK